MTEQEYNDALAHNAELNNQFKVIRHMADMLCGSLECESKAAIEDYLDELKESMIDIPHDISVRYCY